MFEYKCFNISLSLLRESVLMDSLWTEMAPRVLEIFIEAAQGQSPGQVHPLLIFYTS